MKNIIYILTLIVAISCTKDNDCINKSKINLDTFCTSDAPGVCGCDGVTYSNGCEAEKRGVISWENGKCK